MGPSIVKDFKLSRFDGQSLLEEITGLTNKIKI